MGQFDPHGTSCVEVHACSASIRIDTNIYQVMFIKFNMRRTDARRKSSANRLRIASLEPVTFSRLFARLLSETFFPLINVHRSCGKSNLSHSGFSKHATREFKQARAILCPSFRLNFLLSLVDQIVCVFVRLRLNYRGGKYL